MNTIERAEAKEKGLRLYYTGRPCKHGHTCERYTGDGACVVCHDIKVKARYIAKRNSILSDAKLKYAGDPERKKLASRDYVRANGDKVKAAKKRYYLKNKAQIIANNVKYVKERKKSDPVFSATLSARSVIGNSLASRGFSKRSKTSIILGCSFSEFRIHIERQFLKGMSWDNRSEWHIDHITPLASATTEAEVIALNHYTNLRPIWAKDNLSKQDAIHFLI